MDIYPILASKPHNYHYLNRYVVFIRECQLKNVGLSGYTEKHHICPKSKHMFPEYKSFKQHPWNCVMLTARQHFVAHWILARAFGGGMWNAFKMMSKCRTASQERYAIKTSRVYEEIRKNMAVSEETRKKLSEIGVRNSANKSASMSKKIWFNNGEVSRRLDPETDDLNGWRLGRLTFTRQKRDAWKPDRKQRRSYTGGDNPAARRLYAAGVVYDSVKAASLGSRFSKKTVIDRCKSDKFTDWYYL